MERITEQTEVKKLCGQIDTVTEELAVLKRLLMEEENFFQMLTLGEIGKETRLEWMRDIFGSHISDETLAFFCILLDHQGLYHFSQVLAEGLELLLEAEKETGLPIVTEERQGIRGIVYSVVPLEKEMVKRLEEQTAELIGKPVTLVNMIDEGLIGGVLISADGKLIDASLKKRMEDLSLRLRSRPEGGSPL